jgi:hypothetical protein
VQVAAFAQCAPSLHKIRQQEVRFARWYTYDLSVKNESTLAGTPAAKGPRRTRLANALRVSMNKLKNQEALCRKH